MLNLPRNLKDTVLSWVREWHNSIATTPHGGATGPAGADGSDADVTAHVAAADPHTGYVLESVAVYYEAVFFIDGGGSVITTGVKGDLELPSAGVIEEVRLLADQAGDIVIDIWKDTYANFPPTVADTITAAAKPTLVAAAKYSDATLTGWTTTVAAEDVLRFNVDSVATVTRVTVALKIRRT